MSRGLLFVGRQCWGVVAGGENTDGQDLRIRARGGNRLCGVAGGLWHPATCATLLRPVVVGRAAVEQAALGGMPVQRQRF